MAVTYNSISELATLLRNEGDKILDATSKLSLSSRILYNINTSFSRLFRQQQTDSLFDVVAANSDIIESFIDLQLIYDFFQKTRGLKIVQSQDGHAGQYVIDINMFHSLKLLEVHRFSLNFIKGVKSLRAQLQYVTCVHSLNTLRELLEFCGADKSQGFIWSELTEAVFSHNGLNTLDASLEFTPCLQALDLSHNHLQNAQWLNCLSNLRYLNLSFNQLESIPSMSCEKLEVLVIRNNNIDDIQEVSLLSQLRELDLGDNCLVNHSSLSSLSSLTFLCVLNLSGNPLSYHSKHRVITAKYLHTNASSRFLLDWTPLSTKELRMVGSIHPPVQTHLERSCSFNSSTTASTVVPVLVSLSSGRVPCTNCMRDQPEKVERQTQTNEWLREVSVNDMFGMHDSGFVAGPRPVSPSGSSIGSASSLASAIDEEDKRNREPESDIEVLSNPSQSSIEVLSTIPAQTHLRYTQSVSAMTAMQQNNSTNIDLEKKKLYEHHRSL